MATITLEQVKELRSRTGAGVVDAKKALEHAEGDVDKAITWLREKGKSSAAKKASRETKEGFIGSYIHSNNKIGVMVALACETDFVARNEKFQELAKNIALHIAATDPMVISPDDVPASEVDAEKEFALKQLAEQKKPAEMIEKIMEGKMKKFREERALLTQVYIKDPSKTIADLIHESVAELGENITVAEFKRLAL